ncbi:unnamed protein product [Brachionus calyciflorus]|uniref:Uncharacterized protein n=1 Tax=Brachionus calyciflorus TaxID=104777 RepID=A0A814BB30_9BILA|nr:unnamed protein product [Brachionus calyciflorus]
MDQQIFNIGSASAYNYMPPPPPSPKSQIRTNSTDNQIKNSSLNNIQQLNPTNQNLYADIQAQFELSIELRKFINIDLFQRGYYQIRLSVKCSNKQIPIKLTLQLENEQTNQNLSDVMFPSTVLEEYAVSKTFLILYRNEEIMLDDHFLFKISTLLNAFNLIESFEKLGLELNVELWFTESDYKPPSLTTLYSSGVQNSKMSPSNSFSNIDSSINSTNTMQLLCCRTFRIKFDPRQGIHLQIPCVFDYFHLSSVSVTLHCSLLTLLPPVMLGTNLQRNLTLSSILFGKDLSQFKSPYEVTASLINRAVYLHNFICTLLLASYESLQEHIFKMMNYLSDYDRQKIKIEYVDCKDKQRKLCQIIQNCTDPETIDDLANRHVAQCSAENIMLWCIYLDNFSLNQIISPYLAIEYHNKRVRIKFFINLLFFN